MPLSAHESKISVPHNHQARVHSGLGRCSFYCRTSRSPTHLTRAVVFSVFWRLAFRLLWYSHVILGVLVSKTRGGAPRCGESSRHAVSLRGAVSGGVAPSLFLVVLRSRVVSVPKTKAAEVSKIKAAVAVRIHLLEDGVAALKERPQKVSPTRRPSPSASIGIHRHPSASNSPKTSRIVAGPFSYHVLTESRRDDPSLG